MFDWTSVEIWTKRLITRNHYRLVGYEMDDLWQEARIVFWKVATRYTDAEVEARAAKKGPVTEKTAVRSRMALYKLALMNRINSLADLRMNRNAKVTGCVEPDVIDWLASRDTSAREMEALELRHDLERSPRVRALLERASWDDGRPLIRCPRRRKDGSTETVVDVLGRLAGTKNGTPVAAELAQLTGASF